MMAIPKRVTDRFAKHVRDFQKIIAQQRAKDVSEADTVTVVKDLLAEVFGYDKYNELTSEHEIRGTYCDLAIKLDNKLAMLIEVKAIGTELKPAHVKQAIDYAANQGCEWVTLTNGLCWHLYHVIFKKPIDKQLVTKFEFDSINYKRAADAELLYLITREGFTKNALTEFRDRKEATSRYMLAAVILSDPIISAVRRELRKVNDLRVDTAEIEAALRDGVLKRDAIEGDEAIAASRRVQRKLDKQRKTVKTTAKPQSEAASTEQSTE
ncbi:MAG: type I restriction enzyme HsdR N-terminal domain-containing protein [Leptolyngbya sp. SIO3F4]|nr:type I restriction enzyme HsdR N-terminal domain-containing protein [Leptolyngbya sp. SIO3F4]